ncbi:MAG: hypothetical protein HIU89_01985 [Proteobacteria bacterium]|nr:hypothetical protein [Pseudomonadota bacterium]
MFIAYSRRFLRKPCAAQPSANRAAVNRLLPAVASEGVTPLMADPLWRFAKRSSWQRTATVCLTVRRQSLRCCEPAEHQFAPHRAPYLARSLAYDITAFAEARITPSSLRTSIYISHPLWSMADPVKQLCMISGNWRIEAIKVEPLLGGKGLGQLHHHAQIPMEERASLATDSLPPSRRTDPSSLQTSSRYRLAAA